MIHSYQHMNGVESIRYLPMYKVSRIGYVLLRLVDLNAAFIVFSYGFASELSKECYKIWAMQESELCLETFWAVYCLFIGVTFIFFGCIRRLYNKSTKLKHLFNLLVDLK